MYSTFIDYARFPIGKLRVNETSMVILDNNNNIYPPGFSTVTNPGGESFRRVKAFHSDGSPWVPSSAYMSFSTSRSNQNLLKTVDDIMNGLSENHHDMVFIWDIEEITLLTRNYVGEFSKVYPQINSLLIYGFAQCLLMNMGFNNREEALGKNIDNINDVVVDDETSNNLTNKKKYTELKRFYEEVSDGRREDGPIIDYKLIKKCKITNGRVVRSLFLNAAIFQQKFHQRWQCVMRCLKLSNERSAESQRTYSNVVLCEDGIAYGAAYLLVSGHSSEISIDNLYSTHKKSKETVFENIRERFGEKCILVCITSNLETSAIAGKLKIPVWLNESNESIETLYEAQRDSLLK